MPPIGPLAAMRFPRVSLARAVSLASLASLALAASNPTLAHAEDPSVAPTELPTPAPIEQGPPVDQPPPAPNGYAPDASYTPESAPPNPGEQPLEPRRYATPPSDLHTYLETRIGATTMLQKSAGYGPSVDVSYGMGFTWIDVGIVGRFASIPLENASSNAKQYSIGAELATRTSLGGGMTFRLGVDPLYTLESFNGGTHSLVGVDGLAQFLFTVDDASKPIWRLGLGFHGGRRWPTSGGDGIWMVGADIIVRTWW